MMWIVLVRRMRQISPAGWKPIKTGIEFTFGPERRTTVTHQRFGLTSWRPLYTKSLTSSLELITNTMVKLTAPVGTNDPKLRFAIERHYLVSTSDAANVAVPVIHNQQPPLCIIFGWLLFKRQHIMNIVKLHLCQGFDVLLVRCKPWQAIWPKIGGQVIAQDILTFMENNQQYGTTILHGFSIGGFVWSQVLLEMNRNPVKYLYMHNMIVGQIWDSLVVVGDYNNGLANAIVPNNALIKSVLVSLGKLHLKIFSKSVAQPCTLGGYLFYDTNWMIPSLFLYSVDDQVARCDAIEEIIDRWKLKGGLVYQRCWSSSPHVSHFRRHPEEYKSEIKVFLDKLNLVKVPDSIKTM